MSSISSFLLTLTLLLLLLLLTPTTLAASSTSSTATSPSSSSSSLSSSSSSSTLSPAPGTSGFTYAGCWNETTGYAQGGSVRALAGGSMASDTALTAAKCFEFCGTGSQYAGLEYGQECWCAPYLSALSTQLPESACDIPCKGANKTACGGSLTLTLYNRTGKSDKSSAAELRRRGGGGAEWSAVVAVAVVGVVVQWGMVVVGAVA
ncbi:WSC domain-containing protein [Phyllosticta citriasiana]|uniref:WSC domain-containing protein n=1 Tax=Phyllosticta citriasiana TaxID=595635 RepID=UPI0030FD4F38